MSSSHADTICAIATPPGRGGVGIIRISGPSASSIAKKILSSCPAPRQAHYCDFLTQDNTVLDQGIALYFKAPNSFTGEDVLELQGHGGPVVLDMLLAEVIGHGARHANPGEFSERAFLNDKMDLAQAEAIADLIDASSQQAAKQALNSLKGEFSKRISVLVEKVIHLRMYVESSIDFPEEEIDFLSDGKVTAMLDDILKETDNVLHQAQQGVLLKEGMAVVIAGRPNAGKSSLLNQLVEHERAIVTNVAGTTRDTVKEHIHIDGMPLHIIDTAGIREATDEVEQIGIQRAWNEIQQADRILLMIDSSDAEQLNLAEHWSTLLDDDTLRKKLTIVYNKADLATTPEPLTTKQTALNNIAQLSISALTGSGIATLKQHLKHCMGYDTAAEGGFSARRRHITAIETAKSYLYKGQQQLLLHAAGELLAEDLRLAQDHLNEITGEFTADDLLGKIFSSFCIGK